MGFIYPHLTFLVVITKSASIDDTSAKNQYGLQNAVENFIMENGLPFATLRLGRLLGLGTQIDSMIGSKKFVRISG